MLNKKIVDLVNEKLPSREAIEIIEALVGARIQWHNIHMLRNWERNHQFNSTPFDQQINELNAQKKRVKDLIAAAGDQDLQVELSARIEIRLAKRPVVQDFISELSSN